MQAAVGVQAQGAAVAVTMVCLLALALPPLAGVLLPCCCLMMRAAVAVAVAVQGVAAMMGAAAGVMAEVEGEEEEDEEGVLPTPSLLQTLAVTAAVRGRNTSLLTWRRRGRRGRQACSGPDPLPPAAAVAAGGRVGVWGLELRP